MEIVTILRELWHRRILVGVVAFAAIVVMLLGSYRPSLPPESRKLEVGVASARILVDTPNSQVVDVAPKGSETLGARANLLANLMAEGEVKAAVARRAGLSSRQLLAVSESAVEPRTISPSALRNPKAHVLKTRVLSNADGEQLPIIEIETQAPDAGGAAKLANAAVTGLRDYLDSKAALERVSDAQRLRVSGFGAAQARTDVRRPGRMLALAAGVFLFLGGCGAILGISALARGWRQAAASEQEGFGGDPTGLEIFDDDRFHPSADEADTAGGAGAPWMDLSKRGFPARPRDNEATVEEEAEAKSV
jgi:hypothetical protein